MRKILSFFLLIVGGFALFFEARGLDKDRNFTFKGYVEYVTTHIEPIPQMDWKFELDPVSNESSFWQFFDFIVDFITFPVVFLVIVVYDFGVLCYGLLPITSIWLGDPDSGGGSGHGGGGFGAR